MTDTQNILRDDGRNPVASFVIDNWRVLAALAVAAVLAATGYSLYSHFSTKSRIASDNELGAIIATKTGPDRMAALEDFLKKAPDALKGAVHLEIVRTSLDQRDFKRAAKAWSDLALIAPEGMKTLAGLGQATVTAQAGDAAQAVKMLTGLLPQSPKMFLPVIQQEIAAIAEEAGMLSEALAAYENLRDSAGGRNKSYFEAKVAELKTKIK